MCQMYGGISGDGNLCILLFLFSASTSLGDSYFVSDDN